MKLIEFKKIDSSFEFLKGDNWDLTIEGISTFRLFLRNSVLFIKNKKFLHKLISSPEYDYSLVTLIIDKNTYESIDNKKRESLLSLFPNILQSSNVDKCISWGSKYFYDEKYSKLNYGVDGRQLGTVEIHPDTYLSQNVFIGENVKIARGVRIHPGAVIMPNCSIGENTEIFPNVTLYPFTTIGQNCRIHAGIVIGADGFGYNFVDGHHMKVWHYGGVIIEDDVELGANTCVDGGTFHPTKIGKGTKIDNMVQVAHNCIIGNHVIMCGMSGIAGSSTLGDFSVLGGYAAISDGVNVGKNCQLAAASKLTYDLEDGSVVGGYPAAPIKEWMKGVAYLKKMSLQKK